MDTNNSKAAAAQGAAAAQQSQWIEVSETRAEFWKPNEIGDSFEGTKTGQKEITFTKGPEIVFEALDLSGKAWYMPTNYMAKNKMAQVPNGARFKLTYGGKKGSNIPGQTISVFSVQYQAPALPDTSDQPF